MKSFRSRIWTTLILALLGLISIYWQSCSGLGDAYHRESSTLNVGSIESPNPNIASLIPVISIAELDCEDYLCVKVKAYNVQQSLRVNVYSLSEDSKQLAQIEAKNITYLGPTDAEGFQWIQFVVPTALQGKFGTDGLSFRLVNSLQNLTKSAEAGIESDSISLYGISPVAANAIPYVDSFSYSCANSRCFKIDVKNFEATTRFELWSGPKGTSRVLKVLAHSDYQLKSSLNKLSLNVILPKSLWNEYENNGLRIKLFNSEGNSKSYFVAGVPEVDSNSPNPFLYELNFSCPDYSCVTVTGGNFHRNLFIVLTAISGESFGNLGLIRYPDRTMKFSRGKFSINFVIPKSLRPQFKGKDGGLQFIFVNPQTTGNFTSVVSVRQLDGIPKSRRPIILSSSLGCPNHSCLYATVENVPLKSKIKVEVFESTQDTTVATPLLELDQTQIKWFFKTGKVQQRREPNEGKVVINFDLPEDLATRLYQQGYKLKIWNDSLEEPLSSRVYSIPGVSDSILFYNIFPSNDFDSFLPDLKVGCFDQSEYCIEISSIRSVKHLSIAFKYNHVLYTSDDFQDKNHGYLRLKRSVTRANETKLKFTVPKLLSHQVNTTGIILNMTHRPPDRREVNLRYIVKGAVTSLAPGVPNVKAYGYGGKCGLKNCFWIEGTKFSSEMKINIYSNDVSATLLTTVPSEELSFYRFNDFLGLNYQMPSEIKAAYAESGLHIELINPDKDSISQKKSFYLDKPTK